MNSIESDSQDSIVYDGNYNEGEYLETKIDQKLSIMDDFG
jgi:hypothetical protein